MSNTLDIFQTYFKISDFASIRSEIPNFKYEFSKMYLNPGYVKTGSFKKTLSNLNGRSGWF